MITQWLEDRYEAYLANLEHLVNIDSGTHHHAGVVEVMEWIAGFLTTNGIAVERHWDGNQLICVSASVHPGASRASSVLLLGHCDTVFPQGEVQRRPFRMADGMAYGPGVADMKSGLLMNAYLLMAWQEMGNREVTLTALFTCDEEIASPRSTQVVEAMCLRHQTVFNAEPARPNGNVVTGRKGCVFFDIEIEGRPAHAGVDFFSGVSAIHALSRKVRSLETLTNEAQGITLNVGLIRGGLSVNTVAPSAFAGVDLRVRDFEQRQRCLSEIRRICEDNPLGERTAMTIKGEFKPFVQTEGSRLLAEKYLKTSLEEKLPVQGQFTGGCSDSGTASACGCDVICGVGPIGGGFHTQDEYIRLDSILKKATILFKTISSLE